MFTRLAHVCLHVSDLGATVDFYANKLGMPVTFTFEKSGKRFGAYFCVGESTFIEAFQGKGLEVVNTGIVHFCLEVADMDAFIDAARAKGVDCSDKKLGCDQSWQCWLSDPDGNRFEIHQYTPKSAQLNGGVVQVDW